MRLFVALKIPTEVREGLAHLANDLRQIRGAAGKSGPRWVRAENLHVTLKFIGEVPSPKLEAIRGALLHVRSGQPVTWDFRGLGFFPNEKRPRVLWAGISASPNLETLASDIEQSLEKVDIPVERRPFAPHLTLARFDALGATDQLRAAIQKNASRCFGKSTASDFHLIESKLKPSGAEYTTVQSFRFDWTEA